MPVEWTVQATEFANCNCAYGCGCQFNALPDKGFCEAVAGYQINQGHFGDVQLDGLRAAAVWHWPGAVHEGNGTMQLIIDERADDGPTGRAGEDPVGAGDRRYGDGLVGVQRHVSEQAPTIVQID